MWHLILKNWDMKRAWLMRETIHWWNKAMLGQNLFVWLRRYSKFAFIHLNIPKADRNFHVDITLPKDAILVIKAIDNLLSKSIDDEEVCETMKIVRQCQFSTLNYRGRTLHFATFIMPYWYLINYKIIRNLMKPVKNQINENI